jgi:uncharacterized protein YjbI with pentapeptide repeats
MLRGWFWIIGIGALVIALSSIVTARYGLGFEGRTLFEWMDILIVPIAVGVGVYLLEQLQRMREQNEQLRREEERERAAALSEYLDQMSEALTEHRLSSAKPGDEVAMAARERTRSILGILDSVRKGQVVSFLSEAQLINNESPVVDLAEADLNTAFLRNQRIREINLSKASLFHANLIAADLDGSNLSEAYLSEASLSGADLQGANLSEASLLMAVLADARNLGEANLKGANIQGADLRGTTPGENNKDLTQQQLEEADGNSQGDPRTLLPPGLYPPKHWVGFPD